MKNTPELFPGGGEGSEEQKISNIRDKKLGNVAIAVGKSNMSGDMSGETLKKKVRAVDVVRDHFPEEIGCDFEPVPLETEEDYKKMFDIFLQEELIPKKKRDGYVLIPTYRPYRETVVSYLMKTEKTIKDLAGESGELPRTDIAIYLDKSARPVSWLVNELWEDFTDRPKPQTEHLAIDRVAWFQYSHIELDHGEYIEGTDRLARWEDLPIHDVKQNEIMKLCQFLKNGLLTHEELDALLEGDDKIKNQITARMIDVVVKEKDGAWERFERKEMTNTEYRAYIDEALKRVKFLDDSKKLKNINDALIIAVQLRGLFVSGGLSEEDLKNPERIMNYHTEMDGKNITIIDEVERSGTTREIAKHFIAWAFPEAASVNFYAFYKAKTLVDASSPQNGQMLMIPFWYSLIHDDGEGRGIGDVKEGFYEREYEERPDELRRAAKFGWRFLGTPIAYETEEDKKSLRFREQIVRLKMEHEKGYIR
jgi:hypoxanthine phosphoribosyltransferase